jgi:hypothetical protein
MDTRGGKGEPGKCTIELGRGGTFTKRGVGELIGGPPICQQAELAIVPGKSVASSSKMLISS